MRPTSARLAAAVLACSFLVAATSATAQGTPWKKTLDVSTSIFFGNSSQRLGTTHFELSHPDSSLEIRTGGHFTYADAQADSVRTVNRRSWDASAALNVHPFQNFSPFVFANVESSLEKQIDSRYGAGGGGRYVFARDAVRENSLSIALLGEKTRPRTSSAAIDEDWLLRWSTQYRVNRKFANGVAFSHQTSYQPRFDDMSDYTISSTSSLAMSMSASLALTLSLIDNYDSLAEARGAASNNDGQIVFGMAANW